MSVAFVSDPGVVITSAPDPLWGTDSPAVGTVWAVKVTEPIGGAVIADLEARVNDVVNDKKQSGPEGFTFAVPCASPGALEILPYRTQIQASRGGHLEFRGWPIHVVQSGSSPFDVWTCLDSLFITSRRFWSGSPWAREWLRNPWFVNDFTSWTQSGCSFDAEHETGTQSAVIGSIEQDISPDLSSNPWGATVTARVKVHPDVVSARGLEVRVAAVGVSAEAELVTAPITSATPRGAFTTLTVQLPVKARLSPGINVLVNNTDPAEVLLDSVSFRITQGDGTDVEQPYPESVDARELFAGLLGDLGIGFRREGVGSAVVGIDVDRFGDELWQVPVNAGLADIWMEYTRTTETVVESTPHRGRVIPVEELTLEFHVDDPLSRSIADYEITRDYTKACSEFVAIGDDGYHGVSTAPGNPWGIKLQNSATAPNGMLPGDLEAWAERQRRDTEADIRTLTVRPVNLLFGAVEPGDIVWVVIDHYSRQAEGWYRVGGFQVVPKAGSIQELELTIEPD